MHKIKPNSTTPLQYAGGKREFCYESFICDSQALSSNLPEKEENAFIKKCERCEYFSLISNNNICDICIEDLGGI